MAQDNVSLFTKHINKMVEINNSNNINSYLRWERLFPDSLSDISDIIKHGSPERQRMLSLEYYRKNGFYYELINYYSTLLKYMGILIPNPSVGKSLQDSSITKRYYNALDFIERLNLPVIGTNIAHQVLKQGIYYGAIQAMDKKSFAIVDLPYEYCRCRFHDDKGNLLVEFNVSYFNKIKNSEQKKAALAYYPKEIAAYYKRYLRDTSIGEWMLLPADIGIAFNIFESIPYFLAVIPATIRYDQAVENEGLREVEELKKIIIQQIPHLNDGTLLFEPQEAEVIHQGTVDMLKASNPNVSVLTSYGDVTVEGIKTNDGVTNTTLDNMSKSVYTQAGVSSEIFAASGSSSLGTSIKFDIAIMMVLANKIASRITEIVNTLYGNSSIQFKYTILPISLQNEDDFLENAYKMANSGYSWILPALAQGMSQKDLVNIKTMETKVLKLQDVMLPLSSAFTQSADSESKDDEGGRPELKDTEKTEKTVRNQKGRDEGTGG